MCFFIVSLILFHLYPSQVSGGCLGAGTGAGSCPAVPFRAEPSDIEHGNGCPRYAECCTEYGYCHHRSSWTAGYFRDCNGESNGQDLPAETVQAERICSGEILEEDVSTSPSPQYLPLEERISGKGQGPEKNRKSKTFVSRVNSENGGGTGVGKRGPQGPVGGNGGVGGHGPAGPNGNCAWDGPGACAGRGKAGGIGGIGGVGGIGKIGWAGPKPNCAWDGPGACKGKKGRTGKNKKVIPEDKDIELQNQTQLASEITIGDPSGPTDISGDKSDINTSDGRIDSRSEEPIYHDYGKPSFDFKGEYNDGNIQEAIELETGTKLEESIFQIDEYVDELRTLYYDMNELDILEHSEKIKKRTAKKASEPKLRRK